MDWLALGSSQQNTSFQQRAFRAHHEHHRSKNLTRAQLLQQHLNQLPEHLQELLAEHEGRHRPSPTSEEVTYINDIDMDEIEHQHQQVQDAQLHPVHPDQHQEVVSIDLAQDHLPQHQQTDTEHHHQEVRTAHEEQCHEHRHQAVQVDHLQLHHSEVEHLAQHHRVRMIRAEISKINIKEYKQTLHNIQQIIFDNFSRTMLTASSSTIMMHIRQINKRGIYNILGFYFINRSGAYKHYLEHLDSDC